MWVSTKQAATDSSRYMLLCGFTSDEYPSCCLWSVNLHRSDYSWNMSSSNATRKLTRTLRLLKCIEDKYSLTQQWERPIVLTERKYYQIKPFYCRYKCKLYIIPFTCIYSVAITDICSGVDCHYMLCTTRSDLTTDASDEQCFYLLHGKYQV